MWEFSVFRALGLLLRTLPYVLFRASVVIGIAAALLLAAGLGAGIGQAFSGLRPAVPASTFAFWGGATGLCLVALAVLALRGRILHRVGVGHLALMVEVLDRRPVPVLGNQPALGRSLTAERFGDAAALTALDRLVRGVIRTATGLVDDLLVGTVPVAPLDRAVRATGLHLRLAQGLLESVVLAHALRTRSENAWEAAHDGLVLYTQNARPIMATALGLSLTGWVLAGAVAIGVLPAALSLAALLPDVPGTALLLALVFGWALKATLYDPFAQACLLQLHLRLTRDQDPLPEWRGRLTQVSDKFRQLGERALRWQPRAAPDA